jgi:two-component system cell cycle response regulator
VEGFSHPPNHSFSDAAGALLVVSAKPDLRTMIVRMVPQQLVFEADCLETAKSLLPLVPNGADCVLVHTATAAEAADIMRELRICVPPPIPPMIALLDGGGEEAQLRALEAGAADAILMPASQKIIAAKMRAFAVRQRRERELTLRLARALENATVDPLTGLFNRRQFERRLREESAYARRHRQPFALVMIDLDHFKAVNDTFGHEEGDRVLAHLAQILKGALREDDTAFRYGGEEFILLLRACNAKAARLVTERVRAELAKQPLTLGGGEPRVLTFSAGVAAAEESNEFMTAEIVARADAAMYRAKRGGRDRVEVEEALEAAAAASRTTP